MNIYNTLILPHLSYATIIWGNCPKTLINRLVVLQKKAIRAITNSSYRAHTASIIQEFKHSECKIIVCYATCTIHVSI